MNRPHNCAAGWVCERHGLPFEHDDCKSAGEPCEYPGCEDSMLNSPGSEPARIVRVDGEGG